MNHIHRKTTHMATHTELNQLQHAKKHLHTEMPKQRMRTTLTRQTQTDFYEAKWNILGRISR